MDPQGNRDEQNKSSQNKSNGLGKDLGKLAHDVFTLADLQAQLLVTDVRELLQSAVVSSLLLLGGVLLGIACAPIALVSGAFFIVEIFEVSLAVGFLTVALMGASLSATLCTLAAYRLRKSRTFLERSRTELQCNLNWLRNVLGRNRSTRKDSVENT